MTILYKKWSEATKIEGNTTTEITTTDTSSTLSAYISNINVENLTEKSADQKQNDTEETWTVNIEAQTNDVS